jgi:ABC-type Zn2+ transport system substrate-binding protein/surface adhesin
LQLIWTQTPRFRGIAIQRLAIFAVLAVSIALNLVAGTYSGVAHAHAHNHNHEHVGHVHHGDDHGHHHDLDNDDNSLQVMSSEADLFSASGFAGCEQDCGGMLH